MNEDTIINYKILGRNMKDARERMDKTQWEVADELNIIVTTYGKFERGILRPNLERLIAICIILCIDMESILRGAVRFDFDSSNVAPTNDEYVRQFQSLLDKAHRPETRQTMITVCNEIISLENIT